MKFRLLSVSSRQSVINALEMGDQDDILREAAAFLRTENSTKVDLFEISGKAFRKGDLSAETMMTLFNLAAWVGDCNTILAVAKEEGWEVSDAEHAGISVKVGKINLLLNPMAAIVSPGTFDTPPFCADGRLAYGIQDLLSHLEDEIGIEKCMQINAKVHAGNYS